MILTVVGISHKTCPIEIREQFFLNALERELILSELKSLPEVYEALVISTCNRTEIYALLDSPSEELLIRKLSEIKKQKLTPGARKCFYSFYDSQAIKHLLHVATGLDSLVIGEKEILGQIKLAIDLARKKQLLGRFLNILANTILRTGKMARSKTSIGQGGASISWAAVEEAKNRLGTLNDSSVLIIGAGKMSHLAAGDFKRKGVQRLYVVNRTEEKGESLAKKFNGISAAFSEIKEILREVDVCICSASAPHYLIEKALIEECMQRRSKELLLIDISMPRNIHPGVADVENVKLIGIDELDKVIEENIQQRQGAIEHVKRIIDQKVIEFYRKMEKAASCDRTDGVIAQKALIKDLASRTL